MTLDRDQSVYEMVEEVLRRQAKSLAERTGQSFERALRIVADTEAGRQLRELADGEHRHKKAREWQANVFWERSEERLMRLFASDALRDVIEPSACTLECACGERLKAEDDEPLFELAREHMGREHLEKGIEGEQVRNRIDAKAHDTD